MGVISEFKEFAIKGNVIDMAVGIVVGAEFNKIVQSIVSDLLMPPIGMLISNVDFKDLFIDLSRSGARSLAEAKASGAATINYGNFITEFIHFMIMAFAVFLMVKGINRLRRNNPPEPVPAAPAPGPSPQPPQAS
jgi:large conductance mechanosensitive channel